MKFNRELFIDETCSDISTAMDIIDSLVCIINTYVDLDTCQEFDKYGLESNSSKKRIENLLIDHEIYEYFNEDCSDKDYLKIGNC